MKCAKCGAAIRPQDRKCRRCGQAVKRPIDELTRKMTLSPRLAVTSGVLLILVAAVLLLYGAMEFGAVLLCLGVALALVGLLMG
jgi:hypothetical protein